MWGTNRGVPSRHDDPVDDPDAFEHTAEKTSQWTEDAAFALGTDDRHEAYVTLKAVLHALRNGMTVEAAGRLAALLPDKLRWAFYESWCPSRAPRPTTTATSSCAASPAKRSSPVQPRRRTPSPR
jgi:hypothetical protein